MLASIFTEFSLPNAASWLYFSLLLGVAVFFQFSRFFSLRNWDLLSLYLMAPGLLLVMDGHARQSRMPLEARSSPKATLIENDRAADPYESERRTADNLVLFGYVWLVVGSVYLFARCLFDLGLDRRPTVTPNVNFAGLMWLGSTLFVCLTAVAVRKLPDEPGQLGRESVAVSKMKDGATAVVAAPAQGDSDRKSAITYWAERGVAVGLHLSVCVCLLLIGTKHFHDPTTGVGMASLYLMLPFTAYHVAQVHHVWPAAFVLWAVYCFPRPRLAGGMLGIAAGSAFFPFLLFPIWFGFYRNRGAGRFAVGFLIGSGASLALTAGLLLLSGELRENLNVTFNIPDWQAWKAPKAEGLWQGSHWAYRLPVFIAYVAFLVLTVFWPSPRNLAQVIAQSAAVILGIQFWYADGGGVYVLWYLPLVLLMMFRPNLVEVRPPLPTEVPPTATATIRRLMVRLRPGGPTATAA